MDITFTWKIQERIEFPSKLVSIGLAQRRFTWMNMSIPIRNQCLFIPSAHWAWRVWSSSHISLEFFSHFLSFCLFLRSAIFFSSPYSASFDQLNPMKLLVYWKPSRRNPLTVLLCDKMASLILPLRQTCTSLDRKTNGEKDPVALSLLAVAAWWTRRIISSRGKFVTNLGL